MLVKDLLGKRVRDVVTVGLKTLVKDAARIMTEQQIGFVVVVDANEEIAGVMSERDILAAVGEFDTEFQYLTTDELMTKDVVTCSPDDSIIQVTLKLDALRIRHLVAMDHDKMVGVLSVRDVLDALSKLIIRKQIFGRKRPVFELASALCEPT